MKPVTALILNDLDAARRMVVFAMLYPFLFFALFILTGAEDAARLIYGLIPGVMGMMMLMGSSKVQGDSINVLILSQPVSRRNLADYRFGELLVTGAAGFALCFLVGLVFSLFRPGLPRASLRDLVWCLSVISLVSWIIPAVLRWGISIVKVVLVVGLSVMVLLQVLFLFMSTGGAPGSSFIVDLADQIADTGPWTRCGITAVFLIPGGLLSWLLSRRLAERREF